MWLTVQISLTTKIDSDISQPSHSTCARGPVHRGGGVMQADRVAAMLVKLLLGRLPLRDLLLCADLDHSAGEKTTARQDQAGIRPTRLRCLKQKRADRGRSARL